MVNWKFVFVSSFLVVFSSLKVVVAQGGAVELVIISENISINAGESALLVCVGFSQSNDSVYITWQKNGQNIVNSSSSFLSDDDLVHRGRLFKQSFLQLCDLQYIDSGNYTCSVSNGAASVNAMVEVIVDNVLDLALITNDTSVDVGDNVLLICVGYGQPSVSITWSRNGQEIANGSNVYVTEEDVELGGRVFRQSFLRLCGLQTCQSGIYNCSINNGISTVKSYTSVSVEGDPVQIVSISNKIRINSGDPLRLMCIVQPAENIDITWTYKGHTVSNASDVSIQEETYESNGKVYRKSILYHQKMQQQDEGNRICTVTNACNSNASEVEVSVAAITDTPVQNPSAGFSVIGIVLAAVVVLAIFIVAMIVVICVCTRKNKKRDLSTKLANGEPDNTYDEIGKGSGHHKDYQYAKQKEYEYVKPKDYDLEFVQQQNSAYGVIETKDPIYMEADRI